MPPTLPPVRPHRSKPVTNPLGINSASGLPLRHGLKASTPESSSLPYLSSSEELDGSPLLEPLPSEASSPRLRALQIPPSLWTITSPSPTLPLLLFTIAAGIGFAIVSMVAAPLPNITQGLINIWLQANNVTSPSYAHVWDAFWYRPQIPWAIACGAFLGPWPAIAASGLWLLLSIAGLPLMASGGGGGLLVSPIFGFSLGLVASAGVAGWLTNSSKNNPNQSQATVQTTKLPTAHETSLTLLQRAQVPSLVSLRRQKKLIEKRQYQNTNHYHQPVIKWLFHQGIQAFFIQSFKIMAKKIKGLITFSVRSIRPCPKEQTVQPPFLLTTINGIKLLLISIIATTTAHMLGWVFLGMLSAQFINHITSFPFLQVSPIGLSFIGHWGHQLSLLSYSYDVLFSFCGLIWVQVFRRFFGIVLFD